MKKPSRARLDALIEGAARIRRGRGDVASQRQSFAIGSAALENSALNRSSIVAISVETQHENPAEIEVNNLAALYDFVISTADLALRNPTKRLVFTPDLIKEAHRVGLTGLTSDAGQYRKTPIIVMGSGHVSASADDVPTLIDQLCEHVNSKWQEASASYLAAYILWRLLWIHPFSDGNGRVARALSYLVLNVRSGTILPGTPTLPALIAQNRTNYYAALEAADKAALSGTTNVEPIEELISELLELQLKNTAVLPEATKARLDATIRARALRAPPETRRTLYGTLDPKYQLWSHGAYLTLHVCAQEGLGVASERQSLFGEPFPDLLSQDKSGAKAILNDNRIIHFLQDVELHVAEGGALYFSPDTGLILARARCEAQSGSYFIDGTLYCIRFGPRTTLESCYELFELLIARHIRVMS